MRKLALFLFIVIFFQFVNAKPPKLYWIIPDGFRTDAELFDMFKWAKSGELPNINKLMASGAWGYSSPFFPSHTPVNHASLFTGESPLGHGIADGPMRIENAPLSQVSLGGFTSLARSKPAIWTTLENLGYKVAIVSAPGSTPPELKKGSVIRGRWGNWGFDTYPIIYESESHSAIRGQLGQSANLFYGTKPLTMFVKSEIAGSTIGSIKTHSPILKFSMDFNGTLFNGYLINSTKSKKVQYNSIVFMNKDSKVIANLKAGEWSHWFTEDVTWKGEKFETKFRLNVIKLSNNGFFRVRLLPEALNKTVAVPENLARVINERVGPMVDYVDNFPPQLIYYPEDKKTFLDELNMAMDWHTKLVPYLTADEQSNDIIIHTFYSPNQMLTSRWWMGKIDPQSIYYSRTNGRERKRAWAEVKSMYRKVDALVGKAIENSDANTTIVLSSDHGVCALSTMVQINNYLAKNDLLKFKKNENGTLSIDWEKSKAIYLMMDNIHVNPNGFGGNWSHGTSPEYFKLRQQVAELLKGLRDAKNTAPLENIYTWEQAEKELKLPKDRIGDLVIMNRNGFGWSENFSEDLTIFKDALVTGYKQAVNPSHHCLNTPFVIKSPSVKKDFFLGKIGIEKQYKIILRSLGAEASLNANERSTSNEFNLFN